MYIIFAGRSSDVGNDMNKTNSIYRKDKVEILLYFSDMFLN